MKLVLRGNLIFEFDESLTSQPTGERENQQAEPSFWTILCSFNDNINTKMKRCTQKYINMVNKNTKANIWMNNRAFHKNRILVIHIELSQGDFNCGASSKADFILNYFLSNFLKFSLKFSISFHPGWKAETIKVTLLWGWQWWWRTLAPSCWEEEQAGLDRWWEGRGAGGEARRRSRWCCMCKATPLSELLEKYFDIFFYGAAKMEGILCHLLVSIHFREACPNLGLPTDIVVL